MLSAHQADADHGHANRRVGDRQWRRELSQGKPACEGERTGGAGGTSNRSGSGLTRTVRDAARHRSQADSRREPPRSRSGSGGGSFRTEPLRLGRGGVQTAYNAREWRRWGRGCGDDSADRACPHPGRLRCGRAADASAYGVAAEDGLGTIEVADSSAGMSAEVQDRAFEPFFTTKGEGGIGNGVPDRGAARRTHRAALRAGPREAFRITLPLVDAVLTADRLRHRIATWNRRGTCGLRQWTTNR